MTPLLYSPPPKSVDPAPRSYRWVILAAAFVLQATYTQLQQGISILAPFFLAQFSLSLAALGLVVSSFNAGLTISSLPTGAIVDRVGVRRSLSIGAVAVFLAIGLAILLQRWVVAVGGLLFVGGLLGGAQGVSSSKTVFSWFEASERGLAMGIRQIAVPAGAGMASLLLPALGRQFGWQVPLGVAAFLQLVAAGLFLLVLRDAVSASRRPVHSVSIRRALMATLKNRDLAFTALSGMMLVMIQYVMLTYLILYLISLKFSAVEAGGALLLVQVGGVLGRSGWGWVSDHLFGSARKPVLQRVAILSAVTVASLVLSRPGTPLAVVYLQAFLIGATGISWNALLTTMMAEVAGLADAGAAMGFNAASVFCGALIAPPLFGLTVDLTHSYQFGFIFLGAITLAALVPLSQVREKPEMPVVGFSGRSG